jgi:tRNA nucleotidyltransferase (CCA-adding enzyme)
MTALSDPIPLEIENVPPTVHGIVAALQQTSHSSFLVGSCVRALLCGEEVRDFEVATTAAPEAVRALFESAIPIEPSGRILMLPTASGPVDVSPLRHGKHIEDELAHRDYSIHAMAYDPCAGELIDPHGGREDLAKGVLRAVGSPADRFAEDPLRALRAARLVASLGLRADSTVECALPNAVDPLRRVARARVREELSALLLARDAPEGLALLRRGGLEQALAPGVASDAAAVVGALPFDFDLRLAGWLRGARAAKILRQLRHPRVLVARIERLLLLHPIDAHFEIGLDQRARRLARRNPREFEDLVALRAAEIAVRGEGEQARRKLEVLREAVAQLRSAGDLQRRRTELALDGRAVMEHLGSGPGPAVGRALRFLTEIVTEDPSRNEPDTLRALLDAWRDDG